MSRRFDFIVIGSGPGGYVAAIREAVGMEIPLSMDHLGHLGVNSIIRLGKAYEKYNLSWMEDVIPWQYTWNAAIFYEFKNYTVTFSVYNLTDNKNWQPSPGFYGNDFLTRVPPRSYDLTISGKF